MAISRVDFSELKRRWQYSFPRTGIRRVQLVRNSEVGVLAELNEYIIANALIEIEPDWSLL